MIRTRRTTPLSGTVTVPPDLEISHLALIVAAIATGRTRLEGLSDAAQVRTTRHAVEQLGAQVTLDQAQVKVDGQGLRSLREPPRPLVADAATPAFDLLAGACAAAPGFRVLVAEPTTHRPLLPLVTTLRQMGAVIDGAAFGNLPPLAIRGGDLQGLDLARMPPDDGALRAAALAAVDATGETTIPDGVGAEDATRFLAGVDVPVERLQQTVTISRPSAIGGFSARVPGAPCAAAFFALAACLVERSSVVLEGVCLNPRRIGAFEALRSMGAAMQVEASGEEVAGAVGSIRARHSSLAGRRFTRPETKRLLQELPLLLVAATQAEGESFFALEPDQATPVVGHAVEGLRGLGADIHVDAEGLWVRGPTRLSGGTIHAHGDHRLALAFAVAGLCSAENVRVGGWSAVEAAFPGLVDALAAGAETMTGRGR